jgi:PRC-barrel domain
MWSIKESVVCAADRSSAEQGRAMPLVKRRASKILNEYGEAQSELIGKAVVLTDGKAGTVENVWLDELHGLRISIKGHDGRWPVSTIKFWES